MPLDLSALLLGLTLLALPLALMGATRAGERRSRWAWGALVATALLGVAYVWRVRGLPLGEPALAARVQWLLVAAVLAALAALAVVAGTRAARAGLPRLDSTDRGIVALTLLALALRLAYPQAVLHAELFGPRLLAIFFDFPEVTSYRESYGQVGFFVLGAFAQLARSVSTVMLSNALFSALLVAVSARLVRRWTGSPAAALATAVILALHPAFVRVGTSEDLHVLGLLLFAGALLAFDHALERPGAWAPLAVGTLLLVLVTWSRQTLVPLIFVPYLGLLERRGWRALRRPALLASALLVGSAALSQVLRNALHGHNQFIFYMLSAFWAVPSHLASEPHPLLDPFVSAFPLPLLTLLGAWRARRASAVWQAPLLGLIAMAVLSAPMAVFGPGVQLTFRLPALFLGALLAGVGSGDLWRALAPRASWARRSVVAGISLVFVAFAAVGAWRLAEPNPQTQELAFLERTLPLLAPQTVVVTPDTADLFGPDDSLVPRPSWTFPHFLLPPGAQVRVLGLAAYRADPPPAGTPLVFYRNLACHTLSLSEGSPAFRDAMDAILRSWAPAVLRDLFEAMFAVGTVAEQPDPALVRRLRHACFEGLPLGEPLGPGFVAVVTKPDPAFTPNLFYPEDEMEIGFFRLRP